MKKRKSPEDYDNYKEAQEFVRAFKPRQDVCYKWAYEYALSTLMNARDSTLNLERKAERVTHFLVPGIGIIASLLTLWSSDSTGFRWIVFAPAICAFICLVVSTVFAFKVLFPSSWTFGPRVKNAILLAEKFAGDENKAIGFQSAIITTSVIWMRNVMDDKAQQLKRSYRAIMIAMLFTVLTAGTAFTSSSLLEDRRCYYESPVQSNQYESWISCHLSCRQPYELLCSNVEQSIGI